MTVVPSSVFFDPEDENNHIIILIKLAAVQLTLFALTYLSIIYLKSSRYSEYHFYQFYCQSKELVQNWPGYHRPWNIWRIQVELILKVYIHIHFSQKMIRFLESLQNTSRNKVKLHYHLLFQCVYHRLKLCTVFPLSAAPPAPASTWSWSPPRMSCTRTGSCWCSDVPLHSEHFLILHTESFKIGYKVESPRKLYIWLKFNVQSLTFHHHSCIKATIPNVFPKQHFTVQKNAAWNQ